MKITYIPQQVSHRRNQHLKSYNFQEAYTQYQLVSSGEVISSLLVHADHSVHAKLHIRHLVSTTLMKMNEIYSFHLLKLKTLLKKIINNKTKTKRFKKITENEKIFLSWHRFTNLPILWRLTSNVYPPPHFAQPLTLLQPPPFTPNILFAALFLWLSGWLPHIWCVILLTDTMDQHMQSLFTLVTEGRSCVFKAIRCQVYRGLPNVLF